MPYGRDSRRVLRLWSRIPDPAPSTGRRGGLGKVRGGLQETGPGGEVSRQPTGRSTEHGFKALKGVEAGLHPTSDLQPRAVAAFVLCFLSFPGGSDFHLHLTISALEAVFNGMSSAFVTSSLLSHFTIRAFGITSSSTMPSWVYHPEASTFSRLPCPYQNI